MLKKMKTLMCVFSVMLTLCHLGETVTYNLENSDNIFEDFIKKYNKSYATDQERAIKYENFKNNLKMINDKNNGSKYAVFDINAFSDLNKNDLLRRTTGFRMGLKKNSYYTPDVSKECNVQVIKSEPQIILPESFDWRDKHGVTPVKNQLECGSCWAFSAIANIESLYNIKHNKELDLSEQHLINCDSINNGCGGGLMHWALETILQQGGIVSEKDEPYYGLDAVCKPKQFNVSISGCTRYVLKNENKLRELLIANGPISMAVDIIDVIDYKEGITDICENMNGLNHAVLLVGYGVHNNIPYWIMKNSWGEEWGEKGYLRVQRNINSCGLMNEFASSAIL
ncbi:cathepsin [Pieris rapae granulovirus Wuhan]|uniref:Viral cathepsin n=2 Tax=Betabaculovirus arrapae TaxID=362830 RepID=D2J4H8_9BBAC|nr:cathepsin [Betabaculovirus arrapae]ACZ63497.1 cathepsin [Betabaculovirus arrapae]AGS18775.1 cathepsin [Pieris rapae granulovirus]